MTDDHTKSEQGGQTGQPEATPADAAPDQQPAEEPAADAAAGASPEADELTVTRIELEERTLDLQRLQAEYLNYKRRVERDRELVRENATYAALVPIIEVLDTIDRAREHEPLEGGFRAVAEQLERVVANLGLAKFGEVGDAFDPTVHEALSHIGTDPDVQVTTCKVVAKAGYKIGDRVVRAAQVLVVDPAEPAEPAEPTEPTEPTGPAGSEEQAEEQSAEG
ncbi:nucleotide exchange factor GrpE [Nocardioides sp. TF02-7]|uniref:nucleotide exchange factor GrpE n=1 Tax=Nocardioides sp. TF02-7 TaxID=2917724 RepID=UPI001F0610EE|nr:nucleotide exchange factor GrpE [Nocardioides sp. TF02-7]UMG94592.1 nucleotide exchange factor GrpE [Nocardioides sp. TF02-7]